MDYFSESISQNNQILPYLQNLKSERQNYEHKQDLLSKELDEYVKLGVILNQKLIVDKLFRVTVKVFDDVFDLYKFGIINLNNYKNYNCKFYLIEIHISNLFQSKIINDNYWYANVSITNDINSATKTIKLKNLIPSESLKIIIPFDNISTFSKVRTTFFTIVDSFFPNIRVNTTNINISYHFTPYKDLKIFKTINCNPVYEISKLYSNKIKIKPTKPFYEYTFTCKSDSKQFLEMLLKNCYHRLDINQLQNLTTSTNVIDVNLSVNNTKSVIKFDNSKGTLKIISHLEELYNIKKYILDELTSKKYAVTNKILFNIQNLRKQLVIEKHRSITDIGNIEIIYREYKELIAKLPV